MRNHTQTWTLVALLIFAGTAPAPGFPGALQALNTLGFQVILTAIGISSPVYIINRKRL